MAAIGAGRRGNRPMNFFTSLDLAGAAWIGRPLPILRRSEMDEARDSKSGHERSARGTKETMQEGVEAGERRTDEARDSKSGHERSARGTKENLQEGVEAGERRIGETAGAARKAAADGVEAAQRQTGEAIGATRKMAAEGHDLAHAGLSAAAEIQGQVVEMGHDQSRRGIRHAARMTDIYCGATADTADNVQALMVAFYNVGRGVQQMQHAWFDLLNRSIDNAARHPHDLLRCRSPVELAETQRDLYRDGVAYMVDATTTMLHLIGETAERAGRSLEGRAEAGR
jgi:Phasin protein